jgi:hypothetical protein
VIAANSADVARFRLMPRGPGASDSDDGAIGPEIVERLQDGHH